MFYRILGSTSLQRLSKCESALAFLSLATTPTTIAPTTLAFVAAPAGWSTI